MPNLLIMAASPLSEDRLRLSAEVRDVERALRLSTNREDWTIKSNQAATVTDLRRALLETKPTVLHFSGHGSPDGLCFETESGDAHLTDARPLAELLHHFKDCLKCVVLNACYSQYQAEVLRQEIDVVIGMNAPVRDDSASHFAVAFYDCIFAGTTFRQAFDIACAAVGLENLPGGEVPVYLTGPQSTEPCLAYHPRIPDVENFLLTYINTPYSERPPLTTSGESLRPRMLRHYSTSDHVLAGSVRIKVFQQVGEQHWEALVEFDQRPCNVRFCLRIKHRDIKLEWEATVGLWSVPVKTYMAMPTKKLVTARVEAELESHYFGEFFGRENTYQSIHLSAGRIFLHGYVRRSSETGRKLLSILSDGNEHRLTLQLTCAVKDPSESLITALLSDSWLYYEATDEANH